jgi:hypothetical protein
MANASAPAQAETRQLNRREVKSRAEFNMKMSVSFLDLPKPLCASGRAALRCREPVLYKD